MVTQTQLRQAGRSIDRTQQARQQEEIRRQQEEIRRQQEEIRRQQEEAVKPIQEEINKTQSQLNSVNKQIQDLIAEKQSYYERGASGATRVKELNNLIDSLATQRDVLSKSINALQSSTNIQEAQAKVKQVQESAYYAERAILQSSIAQKEQSKLLKQAKAGEIQNVKYNSQGQIISYEIPVTQQASVTEAVKTTGSAGVTSPTTTATAQVSTTFSKSGIKKDSNIIKDIGTAISSFGAGIGNVLHGRDFGTSVTTKFGETLYPAGSPEFVNIPAGAQPVLTLGEGGKGTQIVYTTPTATYNSKGEIISSISNQQIINPIQSEPIQSEPIQSEISNVPSFSSQFNQSSMFNIPTDNRNIPIMTEIQRYKDNRDVLVRTETQRYKNLGYTDKQAKILANESANRGGVTFTSEGAKSVLKQQGYAENIEPLPTDIYGKVISGAESEILNPLDIPFNVLSVPSRMLDTGIEKYKEYSASEGNIFQWGLTEEQKKNETITARGRFYREKVFAPVVRTAPYLIPYVGEALLVSDIAKGVEQIRNPEDETKIINKVVNESWKQYSSDYSKAEKGLEEGYELEPKLSKEEFTNQVMPEVLNQIKTQGARNVVWGGIGVGVSGASALVNRFVPRQKYFGLTGSEYKKLGKQTKEQIDILGSQDIKWLGSLDEGTKAVKVIGEQTYDDLSRQIFTTGTLKTTESGKVLLPEAQGFSFFSGKIKVGRNKEVGIVGRELFETGVKTGGKLAGTIDDVEIYKMFSESTSVPKVSTYAFYNPSKVSSTLINKQLKKNIFFGGEPTKEFSTSWALGFGEDISKRVAGQDISKLYLDISPTSTGFLGVKSPPTSSGVKFIQPADITKTPFSKTFGFQEQIPSLIKGVATPKITPVKTTTENIFGFGGLTTFTAGGIEATSKVDSSFVSTKTKPSEIEALYLSPIQESVIGTKEIVRERVKVKQPAREKDVFAQFIQPTQMSIQSQPQISELRQKQIQQQISYAQIPIQRTKMKIEPTIKPIPIVPKVPKSDFGFGVPKVKLTKKPQSFEVWGRRFGKDILLKKARTKGEAEFTLKSFLRGTLGRSGFVSKEGEMLDINLGLGFVPSKKQPKRVVQKAEFSLGTFPERKEIQYFRKTKGKSNKKKRGEINWLS